MENLDAHQYDSLSEAIDDLDKRGFKKELTFFKGKMKSGSIVYDPWDLIIQEHYRFEGESNPDDMSIVYALVATDGSKHVFIDAYGAYSDNQSADFIKKVKIKEL